jgi:hypothetical protein
MTSTPRRSTCQTADLNQSGKVDIFDVALLVQAYDSLAGDELYNAAYDFDGNGRISILDLQRVTNQFDQVC